jgi:hypothetical protein
MGWPPVIVELGASEAMERWNVTEPKLSHLSHPLMHCYLVVTGMDCRPIIRDWVAKREVAVLRQHVSFSQQRTFLPSWRRPLCATSGLHAVQQKGTLLDHLVSPCEQRCRHIEAEDSGGFQVDHQLEFGWKFDWQVGWLGAF